ncbi:MAG: ABC transporter ATP-binding protein [Chloroflexi bacterium]|nr:ABC transporter ATP-binding protein [Chloroflexota bacterium]
MSTEIMLSVRGLYKQFTSEGSKVAAVDGVSFEINQGELFTLLGPSGCGKTTSLRCIAGLETPAKGSIVIDNKPVFDSEKSINVGGQYRPIGMVFQSYAIWPHMTVFDNVAFPLVHGRHKLPKKEVQLRVTETLELVQLGHLARRPAPFLSGGQQQRVALARAIVAKPKLLLLDEPLSNLDAKLREEMRTEMKRLVTELGVTGLYVTHDQVEALSLSDRIAVMRDGKIIEQGAPRDIYLTPNNQFTSSFVGRINLIRGKVVGKVPGTSTAVIETPVGRLKCHSAQASEGEEVALGWRPEAIRLSSETEEENVVHGKVESLIFVGEAIEATVRCQDISFKIKTDPSFHLELSQSVALFLPPEKGNLMQAAS